MPRGSDIYSSPWLKAQDLQDDEETFTIAGSDVGTMTDTDGREKQQIVLSFHETEKRFGLNVTNYSVLKQIFQSDNSDDWHGKQVVLFVTQTSMSDGRQVDCLRVKRKATEKLLFGRTAPAQARPQQPRQQQPAPAKPASRQTAPPVTQAEVDAAEDDDIPF